MHSTCCSNNLLLLKELLRNKDDDLPYNPNVSAIDVLQILQKLPNNEIQEVKTILQQWLKFHACMNMHETNSKEEDEICHQILTILC